MIQQLKQTENYRSYLDPSTGDVVMQGNPDGKLISMTTGETFFEQPGYYEVIIRGKNNIKYQPRSVSGHIHHKRHICRILRGYTDDEVETLSETDLDGILWDYAKADMRNANSDSRKETS